HAAALAGQEPGRVLVVDPHVRGGQDASLRQAHQVERVKADVHAAGHRDIKLAAYQRGTGGGDRGERGRTAGVDREAASGEAEVRADRRRDRTGRGAGQRPLGDGRERGQVARGRRLEHGV